MGNVPSAKIRNVALVGHGGSGKTTLAEALLSCSGAISRPGRVEDGTTVCDFEPEEHQHQISISLALAPIDFDGIRINVIDTPGYADFVNEVESALSVADLAIVVVSAVDHRAPYGPIDFHTGYQLGLEFRSDPLASRLEAR